MMLPNAHNAVVEREKITEYLLADINPPDPSKPDFFFRFGFSADDWQAFAEALKLQGATNEVVRIVETPYGLRYHIDGSIDTPDGRNPWIKTVWQIDAGTDYPRLITARPLRRQNGASRT